MRTQSPDTSPEAELRLIERIRQAPVSKRFRLVQSLSQRMVSGQTSEQDFRASAIHAITSGYGQRIGQRVRVALAARPDWREQPVDLTATLLPVMLALREEGICSYIGGSLASSIHGMQQSASDIDLVLMSPDFLSVKVALTSLSDRYLVELEDLAPGLCAKNLLSLIHIETLLKIDLILPHTPDFDEAMQNKVVSLLIDERYDPFPVASALEMVTWKLARCAKELTDSSDGIINDAEWNDMLGMLKVQGSLLDVAQITYWARILNAKHLLPLALDDAGLLMKKHLSIG